LSGGIEKNLSQNRTLLVGILSDISVEETSWRISTWKTERRRKDNIQLAFREIVRMGGGWN
jgi:hypothetical protein